jgi:hypothetical protein
MITFKYIRSGAEDERNMHLALAAARREFDYRLLIGSNSEFRE